MKLTGFILLFVVLCTLRISVSVNILVVLPCYGGHFTATAGLATLLSTKHHVTILETSPACQKKLHQLEENYSFDVIHGDFVLPTTQISGTMDFMLKFGSLLTEASQNTSTFLLEFLKGKESKYDLIVADMTQEGVLIAAEVLDIPAAVLLTLTSAGVENVQEKISEPVMETLVWKLAMQKHVEDLRSMRKAFGLADLVSQGDLFPWEYLSRFPMVIITSPEFHPEPHPSLDYIFIGGFRNESDHKPLDLQLLKWMNLDKRDIIYVSMGTFAELDEATVYEFSSQVQKQQKYRFIWSLSETMQETVAKLSLQSDANLFFSKYLPQYTLLGYSKVKVFVTHAGLLSSIDAVKRRKPAICIPVFADQFANCKKMRSHGMAEELTAFNFEQILTAIEAILVDHQKYVEAANKLAHSFEKYENVEALNAFVDTISSRKKTTVVKEFQFQINTDKVLKIWQMLKLFFWILMGCSFVFVINRLRKSIQTFLLPKEKTA